MELVICMGLAVFLHFKVWPVSMYETIAGDHFCVRLIKITLALSTRSGPVNVTDSENYSVSAGDCQRLTLFVPRQKAKWGVYLTGFKFYWKILRSVVKASFWNISGVFLFIAMLRGLHIARRMKLNRLLAAYCPVAKFLLIANVRPLWPCRAP